MKNYKYFRVLVCLLLVCCLIVNVSPIKARAVGVEWILRQIATDIGVSAILEGLGIFRDAASDSFGEVIDDVSDALDTAGYVTNGMLNAYCQVDPLGAGSPLFAIPATLINFVRNWVFDNGVVVESVGASSGTVYSPSGVGYRYTNASAPVFYKQVWYHIDSEYFGTSTCLISSSTFKHNSKVNTYYNIGSAKHRYSMYSGTKLDELVDGFEYIGTFENNVAAFAYLSSVSPGAVVSVSPGYDLSLGVIAPSDTLFSAAYPQWLEHQRELEDSTTETVVQIGLGNTQAETESLTQEQIWSGQGTLTVPDQGQVSDSVILPGWLQQGIENLRLGLLDILDTLISLPVSIAEALAKVFIPSKDYISAKVEAIRGEFGFIDSVIATGEFIRDSISGASGPPVIYVDLGRAPSGNYGSQRVLLTDFSWYAPYKGQVDTVLSAALWAFFGWRVFLKLPGIIGGESGYISDVFFPSSSGRSGSDDKKKGGKG